MKGSTPTRLAASITIFLALAFGLAPAGALAQENARQRTTGQKSGGQKSGGNTNLTLPARKVIWHDPGAVETLNFAAGPGGVAGAPKPPFTFIEEDLGGSNPKVKVKDASGVEWTVKFGEEVKGEVFSTRMLWAVGYFAEPAYFVPTGTIAGVRDLKRAANAIEKDGAFTNARFEIKKEKGIKRLKDEQGWSWLTNPFVGTKELNGLKIMLMLTSNWDNKDVRDISRGSNTAILVTPNEATWVFTDWGATMGAWGGGMHRSKWNSFDYERQTKDFVKGVKNGTVEWGYSGQHSEEFTTGIPIAHVKWLMQYLGRITDDQLRAGLMASGADSSEVKRYSAAIRNRINQLNNLR
jgi:hypothetical protein